MLLSHGHWACSVTRVSFESSKMLLHQNSQSSGLGRDAVLRSPSYQTSQQISTFAELLLTLLIHKQELLQRNQSVWPTRDNVSHGCWRKYFACVLIWSHQSESSGFSELLQRRDMKTWQWGSWHLKRWWQFCCFKFRLESSLPWLLKPSHGFFKLYPQRLPESRVWLWATLPWVHSYPGWSSAHPS